METGSADAHTVRGAMTLTVLSLGSSGHLSSGEGGRRLGRAQQHSSEARV